jgi:hypothetical protein
MYRTILTELFLDGGIEKSNLYFYTSFGQPLGITTEILGNVISLRIVNEKVFVLSSTTTFVPNNFSILNIIDLNTGSKLSSTVVRVAPVIISSMHVTPDKIAIVHCSGITYVLNEDCEKLNSYVAPDEDITYGFGNMCFADDLSGTFRVRDINGFIISEFISGTRFIVSPRRDPFTLLYCDITTQKIGIFDIRLNKTLELPTALTDPIVCLREGPDGKVYVLTCPLAPGAHIPFLYVYNDDLTYYGSIALHDMAVVTAPYAFDFDDVGGVWLCDPDVIVRYKSRDGLFEWTDGSLNVAAEAIISPFVGGNFISMSYSDMSSHSYLLPYIKGEKVLLRDNVLVDVSKGNVVRQDHGGFDLAITASMLTKSRENIYEIYGSSIKVFQDSGGYLYSFDVFEPDGFSQVIFLRLFGCSAKHIISYVLHADGTKWIYWISMLDNSVFKRLPVDLLEFIIEPKVTIDISGNIYVLGASDIDPLKLRIIKYSMNRLEWESDMRMPGISYEPFIDGMMVKPIGISINLEDRVVVSGVAFEFPGPPGNAIFYCFSDTYRLDGSFVWHWEDAFADLASSSNVVASNAFTVGDACVSLYGDHYMAFVFFGGHNDIVDPGSVMTVMNGDGVYSSHLSKFSTNFISSVRLSVDTDNLPVGMFVGNEISEFIKFFQGGVNADLDDDYSIIILNVSNSGIPIADWRVLYRPFLKGVGK